MSSVALGAAAMAGVEILKNILQIAGSPDGLAWIGRRLADKQPEIDARVNAMKEWPDPRKPDPPTRPQ